MKELAGPIGLTNDSLMAGYIQIAMPFHSAATAPDFDVQDPKLSALAPVMVPADIVNTFEQAIANLVAF